MKQDPKDRQEYKFIQTDCGHTDLIDTTVRCRLCWAIFCRNCAIRQITLYREDQKYIFCESCITGLRIKYKYEQGTLYEQPIG